MGPDINKQVEAVGMLQFMVKNQTVCYKTELNDEEGEWLCSNCIPVCIRW